MTLKYLVHNIDMAETEVIAPSSQTQSKPKKRRKKSLICLLLLSNIIVWNILYGICTAQEDKPIYKVVTTDNLISKLWKKYNPVSKSTRKGTVNGIIFNEINPMALINNKLVSEGDTIHSVKVVHISPEKIQFEKNDKTWTQEVGEKPSELWENSEKK